MNQGKRPQQTRYSNFVIVISLIIMVFMVIGIELYQLLISFY